MALSCGIVKGVEVTSKVIVVLVFFIDEKNKKEIQQIVMIVGNNDFVIGKVFSDVFIKVGKDGVIIVEEGCGNEMMVEVVEGMQFECGFLLFYFVMNEMEVMVDLDDCYVLFFEEKISLNKKFILLLEFISKVKKLLLIIVEDVEGEVLAMLVVNKMCGILNVCVVKVFGYGDRRKVIMGDLGVLMVVILIFKDFGIEFESVQLSDLGWVKKVKIIFEEMIIVGGVGKKSDIEGCVDQICNEIEVIDSEYDCEKLQECLVKLVGGVVQINCGVVMETEMKECKVLFEDVKVVIQVVLEEGIVFGGGVVLL